MIKKSYLLILVSLIGFNISYAQKLTATTDTLNKNNNVKSQVVDTLQDVSDSIILQNNKNEYKQGTDTLRLDEALQEKTMSEKINDVFEPFVDGMSEILFWDPFSYFGIYDPVVYHENGTPYWVIGSDEIHHKNGTSYNIKELTKTVENGETIYLVSAKDSLYKVNETLIEVNEDLIYKYKGKDYYIVEKSKKTIPFIVVWLVLGAIFFTVRMKFINVRGFKHSIELVQGKFDKPGDEGEVSHFQALATALSATVGLGNIAGVAIAITVGGPGATFWMIIAGLIGMTSKFVEVTLGVKYRTINEKGEVSGGPMHYLSKGLKNKNLGKFGLVLAFVYAILVIGASIGGGNMFQANQSFQQFELLIPIMEGQGVWFGAVMAIFVGIVIIGGIQGIAKVTEKIVPFMALLYLVAALVIIAIDYKEIGHVFAMIFNGAFAPEALKGGVIGVLIVGFQRASFSNEAGIGSASIAHSAVKTDEPVSEGIVALLEPFIDTVVICTLTALVIIFTGYHDPAIAAGLDGAQLTSRAFGSVISWFPYVLVVAIMLFAFSSMISWSYYGLKGFDYLLGGVIEKLTGKRTYTKYIYFTIFLFFTVVGAASSMTAVMDFSDMMILSMAFPNIIGLLILSPEVYKDLKSYLSRVKSGEIKKYK